MFDSIWNSIRDGASWLYARMGVVEKYVTKHINDNLEPVVSTPARKVLTGTVLMLGTAVATVVAPFITIGVALAVSVWCGVKRACDSAEGLTSKAVTYGLLLVVVDALVLPSSLIVVGCDYMKAGMEEEQPSLSVVA